MVIQSWFLAFLALRPAESTGGPAFLGSARKDLEEIRPELAAGVEKSGCRSSRTIVGRAARRKSGW
jgi:hypothetical protein